MSTSTVPIALPAGCPHRPPCPGCPRFAQRGLAPDVLRRVEACRERLGVPASPVRYGPALGFRKRSRLAVRGSSRRPRVGIFERGTHRVVDVPECAVHDPIINRVADALRQSISETATPVYQEESHVGLVRYLQVVVERGTQRAQVVVVANSVVAEPLSELLLSLTNRLGSTLHSLWFNGQSERANHILGPHWHQRSGPPAVEEAIGGARVFFPPGAFGQANLDLADQIVGQIHAWVLPGVPVVELYSGVGAIGLGLVNAGGSVTFNEVAPQSLRGLRMGIDTLSEAARGRVRVVPGPAARAVASIDTRGAQVIVDPPRKGLDPDVLLHLINAPPRRITYLSCALPAFERDAEGLVQGGYRCTELYCYDLFPFTDHVEILAHFVRA